jgi:hypothetical protein
VTARAYLAIADSAVWFFVESWSAATFPPSLMGKVSRWTVEENFQAAKELTGLDQHQVRRWTSGTGGPLGTLAL